MNLAVCRYVLTWWALQKTRSTSYLLTEATAEAQIISPVKESAQINALLGLQLYKALSGEQSAEKALNTAAHQVYQLSAAGYQTQLPPDLPDDAASKG
jgi:multiple sugar transport system substrate-binding protein